MQKKIMAGIKKIIIDLQKKGKSLIESLSIYFFYKGDPHEKLELFDKNNFLDIFGIKIIILSKCHNTMS